MRDPRILAFDAGRLTVVSEMSPDGQNWVATGSTESNSQAIDNPAPAAPTGCNIGALSDTGTSYIGAHMRFKITHGGVSGSGRLLNLYVTCRNTAA